MLIFAFASLFADVDECSTNAHRCDVNAVCNNINGSYNCSCNAGYSGDGKTCTGKGNHNTYTKRVIDVELKRTYNYEDL